MPAAEPGPACGGRGVSRIWKTLSAAAVPSALAWYWAATARSGRYASGVSRSTSSAAWYGMCPYSSRSPVSTATKAVARAADSSRTSADRNAMRSVAMVADRCSLVTVAITCSWNLARPNALRVGRPCTTSRKCPPSWASSRHWRRVAALVCRPTRAANSGISGSVTAITRPEIQSVAVTVATTAAGTSTDSTSCGRYRAK